MIMCFNGFCSRYDVKLNNVILAEPHHVPMYVFGLLLVLLDLFSFMIFYLYEHSERFEPLTLDQTIFGVVMNL